MLCQVDEVLRFELAELQVRAVLEVAAALRRSARIAAHHDVAFLAQEVVPVEGRAAPAVVDRVHTGASCLTLVVMSAGSVISGRDEITRETVKEWVSPA